ncbi:MAG TPA: hypothetical protein VHK69_08210, partial [Chitinophagaceae bacterium]|nr:hypothetical protein [Chitinophagaceae bacterium]
AAPLLPAVPDTSRAMAATRSPLVQELLRLDSALRQNDSLQVAGFFRFPLRNSELWFKTGNEEPADAADQPFNRSDFLKHYHALTGMLKESLEALPLEELDRKNRLEQKKKVPGFDCPYHFTVEREGQEVILNIGLEWTENEKGEVLCPESNEIWRFRMNGGRLQYVRMNLAG